MLLCNANFEQMLVGSNEIYLQNEKFKRSFIQSLDEEKN